MGGSEGRTQKSVEAICRLLDAHDFRVRLLFQLHTYISLVKYDPDVAKSDRSYQFQRFVQQFDYDPWVWLENQMEARKDRRQVVAVQRMVEEWKEAHMPPQPITTSPSGSQNSASSKRTSRRREFSPPLKRKVGGPNGSDRKSGSLATAGSYDPLDIDSDLAWPDEIDSDATRPSSAKRPRIGAKDSHQMSSQSFYFNHPAHFALPKQYEGDLGKLLISFRMTDADPVSEQVWIDRVEREATALRRVNEARRSGFLKELETLGFGGSGRLKRFQDPPQARPSHHDALVAQAAYLGKLQSNLRRQLQSVARRNSQSVDSYFRRLLGAEDRERKNEERQLRLLARRVAQEVMKKWKLAEKVVQQRRQAREAEEQREKGKVVLEQILEQSAHLVESRFDHLAVADDGLSGSDRDASDEHMSESEGEGSWRNLPDSELTVEQLRYKYSDLPDTALFSGSQESGDEDDEVTSFEPVGSMSPSLEPEKPTDEALRIYAEEAGLGEEEEDEDDESEITDEDDSESERSDETSGDDSMGQKPSSLAALLGGANIEAEDDEDFSDPSMSDSVASGDGSAGANSPESRTNALEQGLAHIPASDGDLDAGLREDSEQFEEQPADSVHSVAVPFLLRGTLREYQRKGLDWLAGLVNSGTNGILADEMGLGKTIQTIALLSWLACEKEVWGPHLIVVPTSVMLNWEMEFKRFAPGLKILTYFGNPQQRRRKRRGWNKEDTWHVCITSYQLVIADQVVFRSKRWQFMILDEAHNIKNFRSKRWQALLNFNAQHRLLLTGTPLQNSLVELWSLLYFLMPSSRARQLPEFASLDDFQEWFARPVDQMVEGESTEDNRDTIAKLHRVLRPYLLRRLKVDVEQQMPAKYEHVINCRLSKRQRYLYDDFMSRASTRATLSGGNFMSILNCLMQLRKVCNHPDLFEVRPILTSLALDKSVPGSFNSLECWRYELKLGPDLPFLDSMNLLFTTIEDEPRWLGLDRLRLSATAELAKELAEDSRDALSCSPVYDSVQGWAKYALYLKRLRRAERLARSIFINRYRTSRLPIYGADIRRGLRVVRPHLELGNQPTLAKLQAMMDPIIARFGCITPSVVCLDVPSLVLGPKVATCLMYAPELEPTRSSPVFHEPQVRLSIAFPDKRLLQYDCGKLQKLASLLRDLISQGHRALIFTQMTRVLDILEQFLNIHGWRYLRLDGATRVEQRQALTEQFNKDPTIPVFILSTRSGGLGINLTGADTVIFYDSDWNPAMDRQCQDRCHRIGQTRDVHIYRLVSEFTIESNILRKATQKTILDNVVIQEGEFTTDYFSKLDVRQLLGDAAGGSAGASPPVEDPNQKFGRPDTSGIEAAMARAEDADDAAAARMALRETNLDQEDFERPILGDEAPNDSSAPPDLASVASVSPSPSDRAQSLPPSQELDLPITPAAPSNETIAEAHHYETGHIDDWMVMALERGTM